MGAGEAGVRFSIARIQKVHALFLFLWEYRGKGILDRITWHLDEKKYKKINSLATSPWFLVVSDSSSTLAFVWFLFEKVSNKPSIYSIALLSISLVVLFIGYFYSIRVRSENIALRQTSELSCEINGLYRDTLKTLFSGENPITSPSILIEKEKEILSAVCQRIENIFSRILNRKCTVTIKLLTTEDGRSYAQTLTRSVSKSVRDENKLKYQVGTGENTAFDVASEKGIGKKPPHYFSPDLEKEDHYMNQRQKYIEYYRSVLVVPIRGTNYGKEGTREEFDNIGFLCIDTQSTHRLNDNNHLYMITSFSCQMYNFMFIMRGRYTVFLD